MLQRPAGEAAILDESRYAARPPMTATSFRDRFSYAFPSDFVVHPGETRPLMPFYFSLTFDGREPRSGLFKNGNVSAHFQLISENLRPKEFTIEMPLALLRARAGIVV